MAVHGAIRKRLGAVFMFVAKLTEMIADTRPKSARELWQWIVVGLTAVTLITTALLANDVLTLWRKWASDFFI